ncbi:succinyldiaminopimelate desuccinylase [Tistlia consotensis]|uniref:Succinyl-diaminopimelate desuccinylase n=1 Tax=Tistlia consotensis USBA 355 TaxID=560819 RepID=A0A1Y6BKA4_9PROT|nr:succinyl-diaminopimelate desuccinylase [Tistlia consotensis]SMF07762.1 succinyldiaminopimelate desuccinylase [Tistlia consotensis USBA 355]SNR35706.1 succinyldiaminopimelate desuccinylase [Tistlia consotensis]
MANVVAPDPLDLTQRLIRCPSVTPAEGGALDLLQSELEALGFACTRLVFEEEGTAPVDNLYARLGTAQPNFCFAGHTDVVPPGDPADWSTDPFESQIVEGELIGRGASDMKGAIAAFVAAAGRFLAGRSGTPAGFGGSISLLITGDEEGPSINGTRKVLGWLAGQGETLDACLVGEPTNPDALGDMVKIGRRGSLTGTLTVFGKQGHTAYPHLADNAAHRLVRMLGALIAEPLDQGTEHFQPSTLQISTIDVGNPASNVVPGKATAAFNIRFNDSHSGASLERWLRTTLDGVAAESGGGRYELAVRVSGESFLTPPGPLSETLAGAIEAVTGRRPELSTTGGTSDARFIKDHCPVAEFGLVGKTMHQVDERAAVADLETLTRIYAKALEDYFG